jgi:hypothetical protein
VGRCCVCVWGPARARERETGRERARTFNRLDEALEYWIDMMQLLSFSIIFQHTHSPSFFSFASRLQASSSQLAMCVPP